MARKKYVLHMTNREAMLLTIAIEVFKVDRLTVNTELNKVYKNLRNQYFKRVRKGMKNMGIE